MKKRTKLQLNRETLHALTPSRRLRDAAGGATRRATCPATCVATCVATCIVSCLDAVCTTTTTTGTLALACTN